MQAPNPYLDYLIDPCFQGVNRSFVLLFGNNTERRERTKCCLPTVERKDYNVMINEENLFDQPVKSSLKTHDNILKNTTGRGDDYMTSSLLDCQYFNKCYKMIAIDLSKQQAFDADPKAIQQNNFGGNLT